MGASARSYKGRPVTSVQSQDATHTTPCLYRARAPWPHDNRIRVLGRPESVGAAD